MNNQLQTTNQNNALVVSQHDKKVLDGMLPAERKIIEAALQPKIKEQDEFDVKEVFLSLITAAYTRAGYKMPDAATLVMYAEEFHEELLEKYPNITVPEVRNALKGGVYGEAGEFTGLNPKTFMQFVRHYLFTEERKAARTMFESKRAAHLHQIELTPEQRDAFNKDFANTLYADHCAGKLLIDFIPASIYDFLEAKGALNYTIEQKKAIHARAEAYVTRLGANDRFKGGGIGAALRWEREKPDARTIAKKFAVADFFQLLKNDMQTTIFPPITFPIYQESKQIKNDH